MGTVNSTLLHLSNKTHFGDNASDNDIIIDYIAVDTGNNVYSLLVTSSDSDGITYEYIFLYDIARDAVTAENLIKKLCENSVTPCSVSDIVYDYLNTFT